MVARLERAATVCAALAFAAMALSISFTQIFVGLALLLYVAAWLAPRLPWRGSAPASASAGFNSDEAPAPLSGAARAVFASAAAFYAWLLLGGAANALFFAEDSATALRQAVRAEWSDLPLFAFGALVLQLARRPGQRKILERGFFAFAVLLVGSGLLALFSEFRLARLAQGGGFEASAWNRPQHPAFFLEALQLPVYKPIGFMNTRLTYAGLLVLALPALAAHAVRLWLQTDATLRSRLLASALAGTGLLVLFINGTRSALLGLGASILLIVYLLERELRALEGMRQLLRDAAPALRAGIGAGTIALLLAAGAFAFSGPGQAMLQRSSGLFTRYTDVARPILWTGAGRLIAERPLLGAGPGRFEDATREWRREYLREHPELWYFFENAPAMHAHNDPLHVAAVGGLPAAALYFLLFWQVFRPMFRNLPETPPGAAAGAWSGAFGPGRGVYLLAGTAAFFFAGVAQCYFQDDEVVVAFWAALGLALSGEKTATRDS